MKGRADSMTGMECLKEELIKRGYPAHNIENIKVLPLLMDILCNAGERYSDINRLEKDIKELEKQKEQLAENVEYLRHHEEVIETRIADFAESKYSVTVAYIDRFFKALDECETPEARDALKVAQMFVNTVGVETKYDNTAFIIGLAGILTKGAIAPVEELQKINKKIPKVGFQRYGTNVYLTENSSSL
jgi:tetratricopeptide (TPR) repeat protein